MAHAGKRLDCSRDEFYRLLQLRRSLARPKLLRRATAKFGHVANQNCPSKSQRRLAVSLAPVESVPRHQQLRSAHATRFPYLNHRTFVEAPFERVPHHRLAQATRLS